MEQPPASFADFFEISGEIGRGISGIVYKARDTALNRWVAIKVPATSPDAEQQVKIERFLRECRVLAHLTAEPDCNIPVLHEVMTYQGRPYCVRELVEGDTLEKRAEAELIDLRAGLAVIAEVAGVVQRVHEQGFAHRNLTAANVLVAQDGSIKLIGFGRVGPLAGSRHVPAGATGTPAAVDIQALGNLLRWLCDALRQAAPSAWDRARVPGAFQTAAAFREAIVSYLRAGSA